MVYAAMRFCVCVCVCGGFGKGSDGQPVGSRVGEEGFCNEGSRLFGSPKCPLAWVILTLGFCRVIFGTFVVSLAYMKEAG
ncbi:hypothetical protein LX32DRAFT_646914 [Colletotrichum zoysiae]|uniref:Uncharacterized protein n=1 Tax=Colletotrichum zoysiae TaxID=1216348 RepID=A0AAD9LT68_9PEZI|nr:hypothetical protein LX32DRAFT_646914 [Colletotrichum zoysiae]